MTWKSLTADRKAKSWFLETTSSRPEKVVAVEGLFLAVINRFQDRSQDSSNCWVRRKVDEAVQRSDLEMKEKRLCPQA